MTQGQGDSGVTEEEKGDIDQEWRMVGQPEDVYSIKIAQIQSGHLSLV